MSRRAVILAGGLGVRLRPFTEVIPKPLLPIGEKSILEIQIERLIKYGFEEVFLATNYKSNYIEKFFGDGSMLGVKLKISKEQEPLGTAGPLKLLEKQLTEPFLVMNGDILTAMNFDTFFQFASAMDTLLTISVKKIFTPFNFGNILFDNDFVTDIQEKPNIVTYANAGIYFMRPEIFKFIPNDTYYGIDNLIKDMLSKNIKIGKYNLHEYWLDIGQVDTLEEAQSAVKSNILLD